MKRSTRFIAFGVVAAAAMCALRTLPLNASGPLGVYGIVDKVVLEPNETSPERIQVWGTFALVNSGSNALAVSQAKRGYLYLKFPITPYSEANRAIYKKEWADLKAVAGTGQAIGFGSNFQTDLRVRPASEAPASPTNYQLNTGIVRLTASGSHAAIVKDLQTVPKSAR